MSKIKLASSALTYIENETGIQFISRIKSEIYSWDKDIYFGLFPEYCWGSLDKKYVYLLIDELIDEDKINFGIILGTAALDIGKGLHNYAIIFIDNKVIYRAKENILTDEKKKNVLQGKNDGIFCFKKKRVAVIVCADIWNNELLQRLVVKEKAEILLVPAFTVVPKGYSKYAQIQWFSLAIVRSRELLIPIAIADHKNTSSNFDVGEVTLIVDPSLKETTINVQSDFLFLPEDNSIVKTIDLESVSKYKQYRGDLGITSY